jgi:hypothetical protein
MRRPLQAVVNNWQLKLAAFAIAFLLWLAVQGGRPYRYRMPHVPVRVANSDPEWIVSSEPVPATVSIEFHGTFRDLLRLPSSKPAVIVPVDRVRDTAGVYILRNEWVDAGSPGHDIVIGPIRPDSVRISFDRVATRLIAVRAHFTGKVQDGYELAGLPIIDPPVVRASGPSRRLAHMDTLDLDDIDVSGLTADDTVTLTIDTAAIGANITPRRVRIVVPIRRRLALPLPPVTR